MTDSKKPRILRCQECGLVVARPSHLARHLQSHLPPARREHFSCTECGRQFSRNDVLLRHLRTAHQAYISRKRSAQKSCFRCVKKKLKCDRGQPCMPCSKSSVACEYANDDSSVDGEAQEEKIETDSQSVQQFQDSSICQNNTFDSPTAYQNQPTPQISLVQTNTVYMQTNGQKSAGVQTFNEDAHFYHTGSESNVSNMMSLDMASYPNTSPTDIATDYSQSFMGYDGAFLSGDMNFVPSNPGPRIIGMVEGGVDWLNLELDSPNNGDITAQSIGQMYSPGNMQFMPNQSTMMNGTDPMFFGRNNNISDARVQPSRPPNPVNSSAKIIEPQASAQQWPFDHTRNPEPQKHRLPPLRDILQGTITSTSADSGDPIRSLVQLLSNPLLPELDLSQDVSMVSAMDLLKNSLELYFSEFHAVLPLVHIPTFNMAKIPTVTLAAMACIGAMYSDDRQGTEQSTSMSEICIQMIAWLGGSDTTNFYKPAYLIACCLHQIYSLGSGNRRLYQNADCSRGILIGCLRGMGILKSRVSAEPEKEDARHVLSADNVGAEWMQWKVEEEEKRIAWSVFEYDCSLCTLTSKRGAVDLPELPSHLPCAEPLWDAPSAQAWAALYSRLSSTARGAPTSTVLRSLLTSKTLPPNLPAWSKRLCAQSIGRLLWDLKQLDIMSTPEYLKLPSMSAAQRQTKAMLLQGLTTICESMYSPITTAELIHYNLASLICHYSHLYSSEEAMDLVVHIFRTSASASKPPDPSLLPAKRRLASILGKNPHKARHLAWHAAQIVSVANEYLVSAPCEIMRVFMGYMFILSFIKFGPQPAPDAHISPVRLDLSNRIDGQRTAVATWIEVGGPASIGLVHNIYGNGGLKAISHEAQTMLRNLRYWGLAKKFIRILEGFDLND
ncbi:hypothetical protein EDD36DRAFT_409050 [Exophiala viscosa]|uniref:Zn(2)-C6 fungal-type domain-containing protein n=1 Tax=Exophiala viscosa TaxID=2486360 RepID=A0AAN6DUQ2_9EURO|nr:hypothetical protein EDD36DRAFT_409050 [Exophiala viscosa]